MSLRRRIIDLGTKGTDEHADVVRDRHIRFSNAVSLIVCLYIMQCAALAVYHGAPRLLPFYALHFVGIAIVPLLNHRGHPIAASACFGGAAIVFVSLYSLLFGVESLNFAFLPMIALLQFFFFSARERLLITAACAVTVLAFVVVLVVGRLEIPVIGAVPESLIAAQRFNSLAGLLLLSIALGAFALVTVARADHQVFVERQKTEKLLHNILPEEVARELKLKGHAEARQFDKVTVLFTDFKGFTSVAERLSPVALIEELNACFQAFDRIVSARGIEKIKTIGDAYMCAGGLPNPTSCTPADVVRAALEMQAFMTTRKEERARRGEPYFEMRVGIHTGAVVAGIVGELKFAYDIWGDTVNTASRMESNGEVGRVNISESTYLLLCDAALAPANGSAGERPLTFSSRGKVAVKGKGELAMYFVADT